MKKYLLIPFCWAAARWAEAQPSPTDSLVRILLEKDIIGKVEAHEALVERIQWTSPSLLVPSVAALVGVGWLLWQYFYGLGRKIDAHLASPAFEGLLAQRLEAAIATRDAAIKGRPVCIVCLPGTDQRRLPKLLAGAGFTQVAIHTTEDTFDIVPNTVVVFHDEDGRFVNGIADYIGRTPPVRDKGRFFYFGTRRFEHPGIRMSNFANADDTFAARLFESLSMA